MFITGEPAPNFVLQTVDGRQVNLEEVLKNGNHVLLVFLRHLG